jgi:uncharacterized metal-binding protein
MNCIKCVSKDCFNCTIGIEFKEESIKQYDEGFIGNIHRVSADIEVTYHSKRTRLEEIIIFTRKMEWSHIGIAFCRGLIAEAEMIHDYLVNAGLKVSSAICSLCGVRRKEMDLKDFKPDGSSPVCNPVGQALALNADKTDLNLIIGLCVGHDMLFTKYSDAPVSTFIVKDRVLGHNPVQSLYNRYLKKTLTNRIKEDMT